MDSIGVNLQAVRERMVSAAKRCGRDITEVGLIAVSKTFGTDAIAAAHAHGQCAFGENHVQEAVRKIATLPHLLESRIASANREHHAPTSDARGHPSGVASPEGPLLRPAEWRIASANREHHAPTSDARGHSSGVASPEGPLLRPAESRIASANREHHAPTSDARGHSSGVASPEGPLLRPAEWHFIGPIQSNKTRVIAQHFDWVHSIERLIIAERLSATRAEGLAPLQVCIQINIGDELSKSGVAADEALALAHAVAELPRLKLRGLMAIPPASTDHAQQRRHFARLRQIKDAIVRSGIALDTLSMGMSDDFEAAIAEGATLVRVGRAIFGSRS